jgi:hypothetical protein
MRKAPPPNSGFLGQQQGRATVAIFLSTGCIGQPLI